MVYFILEEVTIIVIGKSPFRYMFYKNVFHRNNNRDTRDLRCFDGRKGTVRLNILHGPQGCVKAFGLYQGHKEMPRKLQPKYSINVYALI